MPFCDIIDVNPACGASVCGLRPHAWESGIAGPAAAVENAVGMPAPFRRSALQWYLRRLLRIAVFVKFQIINNIRCRHSAFQRNAHLALANIYVMSLRIAAAVGVLKSAVERGAANCAVSRINLIKHRPMCR